jgi:hypothetical protein
MGYLASVKRLHPHQHRCLPERGGRCLDNSDRHGQAWDYTPVCGRRDRIIVVSWLIAARDPAIQAAWIGSVTSPSEAGRFILAPKGLAPCGLAPCKMVSRSSSLRARCTDAPLIRRSRP